ncbi:uncharacterized protein LOC143212592 [Lasioglossum baleicum]|uniref:uncharacterized protein LOC143212592 n=1 Tax=Lasioglossum baleicum TaxID=434251 RepID=UPI003FCD576D
MAENETQSMIELEQLIDKTTRNLGKGYHSVRYDLESPTDAFYVSSMFFVNITVNYGNENQKRTIRLVVKKPSPLEKLRTMMRSDAQFHNEILFYEKYAVGHKDLPVCYYKHEEPPTKSVLVLENIEERGFHMCQWRYNVPMDYTMAGVRELARFHAKGYVMKERRRSEFFDIIESMHESRYDDDDPETSPKDILNSTGTRGIEYLRDHGHDEDFCAKMIPFFEDMYENVVVKCIEPEEPLATLCHGDFTVNNTFFKEEDGKVKAMFIDFALVRYGSPVIDLSSYLCLHCPENLSTDLIESVFRAYNDSLMQCLEDNGIKNRERFSYEALLDDYKLKGLFGYAVASFFLAVAMGKEKINPEEVADMDIDNRGDFLKKGGGDEISEILANMLLKLQEFGCLDHVL